MRPFVNESIASILYNRGTGTVLRALPPLPPVVPFSALYMRENTSFQYASRYRLTAAEFMQKCR